MMKPHVINRAFYKLSLFAVALLFFVPAKAEEISPVCRLIVQHIPQGDVAYKAGVDVKGNEVVPADLNSTSFQVPNVIKVPLDIQLAERLESDIEGLDLQAPMGVLEIYQDGRVLHNGQDWASPISQACEIKPPEDGQKAEDVIKSEIENNNKTYPAIELQDKGLQGGVVKEVYIGQIEVDPLIKETQE